MFFFDVGVTIFTSQILLAFDAFILFRREFIILLIVIHCKRCSIEIEKNLSDDILVYFFEYTYVEEMKLIILLSNKINRLILLFGIQIVAVYVW